MPGCRKNFFILSRNEFGHFEKKKKAGKESCEDFVIGKTKEAF